MVGDENNAFGKTLSDYLDKVTSEREPTTKSVISSMQMLLEIQCKMRSHAIQHNTQFCVQNAIMMESNLTYLMF